jgi:nicotinamide-nucleotide amidase
VAESCTGGLLSARLTSIPGSSKYFMSGMVTYSNQSKIDLAGIPPLLLDMQGAVSEEVARGLAVGRRAKRWAHNRCGVTGIAGPGGGTLKARRHSTYCGSWPGAPNTVTWCSPEIATESDHGRRRPRWIWSGAY